MIFHSGITDRELRCKIRKGEICFAGNKKLRIYGLLSCKSGRRMNRENRVFFTSVDEARVIGFRPCGHCMKAQYKKWKDDPV